MDESDLAGLIADETLDPTDEEILSWIDEGANDCDGLFYWEI